MERTLDDPGSPAGPRGGAGAPFRSATFSALGWDFAVATHDPALTAHVDRVFGSLACTGEPAHRFEISEVEGPTPRTLRLTLDGDELETTTDPARPLALIVWHVNRAAIAAADDDVLLHASAAAHDGAAVVMAGDMEVGKTTLVTALVRAGLSYLTDEAVAVDPATGELRAFPRALSLDPGSWPLFPELEPAVDPAVAPYLPDQWQVPPDAIRPGAAVARARARVVVFPRYRAGAGFEVVELGRADALVTLARCAFNLHAAPQRNLEVLGDVVRGCRCFTLDYDDLDAAVDWIVELVQAATGADTALADPAEGAPG